MITTLKKSWVSYLIFFFNLGVIDPLLKCDYLRQAQDIFQLVVRHILMIQNENFRVIPPYCVVLRKSREKEETSEVLVRANSGLD